MYIKLKKVKINIVCAFMIFIFSLLNMSPHLPLLFFSLAAHEIGHIIFIKINRIKINSVEILPFGVNISAEKKMISYKSEIWIFAAGPFFNFISALAAFFLMKFFFYSQHLLFFFTANLTYGIVNIFPVKKLDGGKILELILKISLPDSPGRIVLSVVSAVFLALLAVAAFFVLMVTGYNFTLVLLCCYLFYTIHFSG